MSARRPGARASRSSRCAAVRRVALLRGVNLGRGKRVAMADLRELVSELGYRDVRTLIASGNVVFDLPPDCRDDVGLRIEEALVARCGFRARTIVLTVAELAEILAGNPLLDRMTNPSLLQVGVLAAPGDAERLAPLRTAEWGEEAFAAGRRAVYYWCPGGVGTSPLAKAIGRVLGDRVTARNWATMTKLTELARA